MADEKTISQSDAREVAALRVSRVLAIDQREQFLGAGRMDMVAGRTAEIAKIDQRRKELGEDV